MCELMGEDAAISSQLQAAIIPSVMATAAWSGLRPVANAFSADTYRRGMGMSALAVSSRMMAKYSGCRASSAGTACAARMASVSLFQ